MGNQRNLLRSIPVARRGSGRPVGICGSKRAVHGCEQFVATDGFGQHSIHGQLFGFANNLRAGTSGDQNGWQTGIEFTNKSNSFQPSEQSHVHVEQCEIDPPRLDDFERFFAAVGFNQSEPWLEQRPQRLSKGVVVVHEQEFEVIVLRGVQAAVPLKSAGFLSRTSRRKGGSAYH